MLAIPCPVFPHTIQNKIFNTLVSSLPCFSIICKGMLSDLECLQIHTSTYNCTVNYLLPVVNQGLGHYYSLSLVTDRGTQGLHLTYFSRLTDAELMQ